VGVSVRPKKQDPNALAMEKHKVSVFRKEHFNAAHRLHNPAWTPEKNNEVFGLCNNPNYHGHNYDLIVQVTGYPDPETGYVIDTKKLSDLIKVEVLARFDHKNLNPDFIFNNNNKLPFKPDLMDLIRLHYVCRQRRVTTVLEIGSGYSTMIIAHALKMNEIQYGRYVKR
jgi:6-pyruvoyl tetrahydropterin synthase/QueD family protein